MRMKFLTGTALWMLLGGMVAISACNTDGETGGETPTTGVEGSLRPVVEPCLGKCDGPGQAWTSPYQANMDLMNQLWPGDVPMQTVEDAFMVQVELGPAQFAAPTHLFGGPVNIIPYSNDDNVQDASGATWERGDQAIAKAYGPGTIGFVIKHRRPANRTLNPQNLQSDFKEHAKLQDRHIGIVVGIERDGQLGAMTLNNPQTYESGLWGTPDYPMIFTKPKWPEYIDVNQAQAFNDNALLMIAGFNAVSDFPGSYNGGDPLGAHSVERLENYVVQMVRAITGDADAQAFFDDPSTLLYCSELGFVGLSAGLHFPLNAETMVPLVGQETWDKFVEQVELQNAGEPSAFTTMNNNSMVKYVRFLMPPEDLKPLYTYSPDAASLADKLAFKPMTMADIVQQFLRTHVPREHLGEQLAPVQGELLKQLKPGLLENMAMDGLPEEDPRRVAVDQLFNAMVEVVSTPYGSYEEFQQAIAPLLGQARQITGPRDDSGTGYFVPPSLYHIITQGKHQGGLVGLEYIGHGLHTSVTFDPNNMQDMPDPVVDMGGGMTDAPDMGGSPVLPPDNPFAGSCANSCGEQSPDQSCWCDDECVNYGDCCEDIAEECSMMP